MYHHMIFAHLENILDAKQPHGHNSLASDQSIEAFYGVVGKIARPLGLPGSQLSLSVNNIISHYLSLHRRFQESSVKRDITFSVFSELEGNE